MRVGLEPPLRVKLERLARGVREKKREEMGELVFDDGALKLVMRECTGEPSGVATGEDEKRGLSVASALTPRAVSCGCPC